MRNYSLVQMILLSLMIFCFVPQDIYSYNRDDVEMVRDCADGVLLASLLCNSYTGASCADAALEVLRSAADNENQKLQKDLGIQIFNFGCGLLKLGRPDPLVFIFAFSFALKKIATARLIEVVKQYSDPDDYFGYRARRGAVVVLVNFFRLLIDKLVLLKFGDQSSKQDSNIAESMGYVFSMSLMQETIASVIGKPTWDADRKDMQQEEIYEKI